MRGYRPLRTLGPRRRASVAQKVAGHRNLRRAHIARRGRRGMVYRKRQK